MNSETTMMITAWITGNPDLLDQAAPKVPAVRELLDTTTGPLTDQAIDEMRYVYDIMRNLALVSATAITCWATSIGVDPGQLMQDIALNVAKQQALTKPEPA